MTTGIAGAKWKAEASIFNGREPDDRRWDFDLGTLDAYSGRVWFMPAGAWALQVSAGHMPQAEASEFGIRRVDVDRLTASAPYHRLLLRARRGGAEVGARSGPAPTADGVHAGAA